VTLRRVILAVALVLGLGFAVLLIYDYVRDRSTARAAEPPAESLADIPALMEYWNVPGVSIAIIRDSEIEQLLTYGVIDQETAEPVTEETLFQAASISKTLTALAALRLAEQGAIDLDEAIAESLASWTLPENSFTAQEEVTWRRLLSHTAGISTGELEGYTPGSAIPSLVQILNAEPPANSPPILVDHIPGSGFEYSNGGYVILQQALIDVGQQPFPQIIDESVLEPLGMTHSTMVQPLPEARTAIASSGHDADGSVIPGGYRLFPEMAAAGLWATPEDLAQLLIELQRSARGQSDKLLDQQTMKEMLEPIGDGVYGLGLRKWGRGDEVYFGHDGENPGFISMMYSHEGSGDGAVVMTNGDNGTVLVKRILEILGETENWPGY
jgi:CubicO group peptidase (beta-lactamase class C family)